MADMKVIREVDANLCRVAGELAGVRKLVELCGKYDIPLNFGEVDKMLESASDTVIEQIHALRGTE